MTKLIIGCGYVGRRVARAWRDEGHEVVVLTRSPVHAAEFAAEGLTPLLGDVLQPDTLQQLPAADTVLYAVGYDRASGATQREVYVAGLQHVLETISSRTARLIYISSTSVYGQTLGEWIDEESACEPTTPNGQVCLDAEQLVWQHFSATESTSTAPAERSAQVLRLAGIYGPGRLVARLAALQAGEPLVLNPRAYLNLIHVADAVAVIRACEQRGVPGRTYVVADDFPCTRQDYYAALARLVDAPPPRYAVDQLSADERRQLNKRCRNARLHADLNLQLTYPDYLTGLPSAIAPK